MFATSIGAEILGVACLAAVLIGLAYFVIIRPRQRRAQRKADFDLANSTAFQLEEDPTAGDAPALEFAEADTQSNEGTSVMEGGSDLESLMAAVRNQAIELRGEHSRAVSNLSLNFDILTSRLSTIEPLLAKAMETATKGEATIGVLTVSNDDYKRKLAEVERDLAHFRPLAVSLEDNLRSARANLAESERRLAALEIDHATAQGAHNDLFQRMASAEMARQRAAEENVALVTKLNEHESTIQSLLRESAHLKSDTVSAANELERAAQETKALSDRYVAEREGNSRANAALNSLQVQFDQHRAEAAAQLKQIEEREAAVAGALSTKEKQFYESEVKRSALDSKIDFLSRTNQRLREDLRRSLDQLGTLEASNRKLLDALARNTAADQQEGEIRNGVNARATPKLRAVPDTEPDEGASAKSS